MKRSQRGCIGCEAKAAGATSWQVAYLLGQHQMAVLSADESDGDDVPDDKVCALHNRLGRAATAFGMRLVAQRGAQRIARGGSDSSRAGSDNEATEKKR